MEPNNTFSLQRFKLLFKQSYRINKKSAGISLAAIAGTMFILLILSQSASHFNNWNQGESLAIFKVFFFLLGIIYTSFAFPAFRTKEKTMAYLMLPVSAYEKFIFEILIRIVAFILFMPLIFWIIANLEGIIVHYFVPELINFKFSFNDVFTKFAHNYTLKGWSMFAYIQTVLFVFIAAFTGASHFSKMPLMKTLFVFSVIQVGFVLFAYLLYKGLNLNEADFSFEKILFIKNEALGIIVYAISALIINISLLTISWFSLKEKEA
jgi:hypothetical protein